MRLYKTGCFKCTDLISVCRKLFKKKHESKTNFVVVTKTNPIIFNHRVSANLPSSSCVAVCIHSILTEWLTGGGQSRDKRKHVLIEVNLNPPFVNGRRPRLLGASPDALSYYLSRTLFRIVSFIPSSSNHLQPIAADGCPSLSLLLPEVFSF